MSGQEQQQQDAYTRAYTRMWENYDNDWNFDALPPRSNDEEEGALDDANNVDFWDSISDASSPPPPPPRDIYTRDPEVQWRRHSPSLPHPTSSANGVPAPLAAPQEQDAPPPRSEVVGEQEEDTESAAPHQRQAHHSENWLEPPPQNHSTRTQHPILDSLSEILPTPATSTSTTPPYSPSPPPSQATADHDQTMPTITTARRARHTTQTPSVVDLTTATSPPTQTNTSTTATATATTRRNLKRRAPSDSTSRSTSKPSPTNPHPTKKPKHSPVPSLDLTTDHPSPTTIENTTKTPPPTGPPKFGARTCIICMEPYTNATATSCGHLYCHECLTQALRASAGGHGEVGGRGGAAQGSCPVCRKAVKMGPGGKGGKVVVLSFMRKGARARMGGRVG